MKRHVILLRRLGPPSLIAACLVAGPAFAQDTTIIQRDAPVTTDTSTSTTKVKEHPDGTVTEKTRTENSDGSTTTSKTTTDDPAPSSTTTIIQR